MVFVPSDMLFNPLIIQNQNLIKPINGNGFGRFYVQKKFKFSFGKPIITVFLLTNFYLNINMGLAPFALDVMKLSPQFTYYEAACLWAIQYWNSFLGVRPFKFF